MIVVWGDYGLVQADLRHMSSKV